MSWGSFLTGAFFFVFWLPGMLFYWKRKGLRGTRTGIFLVESMFEGLFISAFVYVSIFLASLAGLLPKNTKDDVPAGLVVLFTEGFRAMLASETGVYTLFYIALMYVAPVVVAWLFSFLEGRGYFSRKQESALDVQLVDIRRRKKVPRVVIEEGNCRTEGLCRVFTFTEPREMLLETKDPEGNICYIWRKIDNGISTVYVYEEEPPKKDEKVVSFLTKLNKLKKTR